VSYLHGRQLLYLHGVGDRSPTRVGGGARALSLRRVSWPTYHSEPEGGRARQRLLVRGRDMSREVETCRARQRLVVGIPLVGNLVGDVAIWLETGRLDSVGLDQGLQSLSS
jgi:hypothetical protein